MGLDEMYPLYVSMYLSDGGDRFHDEAKTTVIMGTFHRIQEFKYYQ